MATAGTRWRDWACSGRKNQAAAKVSPLLNITSRFSIGTVRSLRSAWILRSWFCGIGEQCGCHAQATGSRWPAAEQVRVGSVVTEAGWCACGTVRRVRAVISRENSTGRGLHPAGRRGLDASEPRRDEDGRENEEPLPYLSRSSLSTGT